MGGKAALLNLLFPGVGYLFVPDRAVQASLLLAYLVVTAGLAAGHLWTMWLHWHHLDARDVGLVSAQVLLFAVQHGFVAGAVAWDAWRIDAVSQ